MATKKGGFIGWLRKLFGSSKRRDKPSTYTAQAQKAQIHDHGDYDKRTQYPAEDYNIRSAYRERNEEIAQKQVAGIRRSAGGAYAATYSSGTGGLNAGASKFTQEGNSGTNDQSAVSSYGTNARLWNSDKDDKVGPATNSAWKGKPVGKQYDRREELTEEDEDMWARMAM